MESRPAAGSLQQPNLSSSIQQPNQKSNVLQGSLQQPNQLLSNNPLQGSLQQPNQQLLSNNPLQGSLQQPNQQLLSNNPLQASLQQPNQQLLSNNPLQGPLQQQPNQQLQSNVPLQGTLQQPNQQLLSNNPLQASLQQPNQLSNNPIQGPLQQLNQLASNNPLQGSLQQPGLASNVLTGSLQNPNLTSKLLTGPLQQASRLSPGSTQQLIKADRNTLTLSDDNAMVRQIQATHAPDGREIDVRPLLHLVEDILNRATLYPDNAITLGSQAYIENLEDKTHQAGFISLIDALSFTIDRISCEIAYKALGGTDAHQTTLSIFNLVSYYAWDAKLVLTLAAFAVNYGEFWLLAQIYSTNQLAKSMAILKQVPGIIEHSGTLKPRFDALNDLIRAILEVTRCVVEFTELPSLYITHEVPALTSALGHIPTAVYWTIRSIVACTAQITSLTSLGYEFISTTEAWELSTLAHKLKNLRDHLKKQLDICYQYIQEKKDIEAFKMLKNLFETLHIDNMRVLKALIYPRDDLLPLVDGSTKRRVNIEVLRRKNVLLLISTLDFSQDELSILEQIYTESRQHSVRLESNFEVVWIPIVDPSIQWTDQLQKQFESLQSSMPWYTVHHPSLIGKVVVKFIREVWHLRNKPILVVLDYQGKVLSPNAIHMMWIWGSNAFPFTSLREEALWREETWRLELLVDGIDQTILDWSKDGKYIFLYGGDDIEWIRKFTKSARAVALASRINLEMVYVGKSNKREKVQRVSSAIIAEKLSYSWDNPAMIWFFWTRLESMLFSKIQQGKADDHDPMMQEIKKLLSYDREGGWAVLARGNSVVVNGHGTTVLPTLLEYDPLWKDNVVPKGFDVAFKEHHDKLYSLTHPCSRFEFSHLAGRIPENLKCPECRRNMDKYTSFLCCHDETAPNILY